MYDYCTLKLAKSTGWSEAGAGLPLPIPEFYLRDGVSLHTACTKARFIEKGIQKPLSAWIFWSVIATGKVEKCYQNSGITGTQQK